MPEIKEKPKAGKPKGRRSAGPPRPGRTADERSWSGKWTSKQAENGSYAVDQVEQAGSSGRG